MQIVSTAFSGTDSLEELNSYLGLGNFCIHWVFGFEDFLNLLLRTGEGSHRRYLLRKGGRAKQKNLMLQALSESESVAGNQQAVEKLLQHTTDLNLILFIFLLKHAYIYIGT